jgi:membrane-bound lytic murein transglycosylase A
VPLTPGRSIAIDNALHMYGTPFFIQADLPLTGENRSVSFDRLMIAQDTGSAIVGPARADIFWGAGDRAGRLANHVYHPGKFALLVPRELDPVTAAARMTLEELEAMTADQPVTAEQAAIILLQCVSPLLMLWTAPPPARECHRCGAC